MAVAFPDRFDKYL